MQWSLVAVIHIVNALFGASCASAENGKGQISSVFESFGYSPACVASALTSCEYSSTKELSVNVVDSIEATKSLLQEIKSEIGNYVSEFYAIRQEMKSQGENSSSVVKTLLQEMKSEVQAVRQEMKSERENSTSIVKTLLQEMKSERENSASVVKSLLQEMKSERENDKNNFEMVLGNLEKITHRISTIEVNLQEATSERKKVSHSPPPYYMQPPPQYIQSPPPYTYPFFLERMPEPENDFATTVNNSKNKLESLDAIKAGVNTTNPQKNCADLRVLGDELSGGVQTVYPYLPNQKPAVVYCDQVTDGGGWTVIQSRSPLPIRENFNRRWNSYVKGFGDRNGEFWLGLDHIHALTNSAQMEMRVDLENAEGEKAWAQYGTFHVGDAASKYVLTIGNYSGDAGDGMNYLNSMEFSTFDNDNDLYHGNCAKVYNGGGWWFNDCYSSAYLNAVSSTDKISWAPFRNGSYSMKKASMKIRPTSLGV